MKIIIMTIIKQLITMVQLCINYLFQTVAKKMSRHTTILTKFRIFTETNFDHIFILSLQHKLVNNKYQAQLFYLYNWLEKH